jgi:5-methylcytosine-specific restriction endonuclease McrA
MSSITKAALKAATRAVIDGCPLGKVMNESQTEWMCRNLNVEYRFFRHVENPTFPNDPRYLEVSQNGIAWTSFSWNKAIDRPDAKQQALSAMRRAVWNGTRLDYKKEVEMYCVECNATDDLCVDHKDQPFIEIATLYIAEHGLPELADGLPGEGNIIASKDVRERWIQYHDRIANFQILCRSCNSSKGAK